MKPSNPYERLNRVFNIAVQLAPAFRDKYDFQDPEKDYAGMAEHAFKAAEAMVKTYEAREAAVEAAEKAEAEKKAREAKEASK